jgi:hypothetical protein
LPKYPGAYLRSLVEFTEDIEETTLPVYYVFSELWSQLGHLLAIFVLIVVTEQVENLDNFNTNETTFKHKIMRQKSIFYMNTEINVWSLFI